MKNLPKIAVLLLSWIFCLHAFAQDITPLPDPYLDSWSFNDPTNWTSDLGFAPLGFTNIVNDNSCWSSDDGILDCNGLILDSTNAAYLNYSIINDGNTNLLCTAGTIWFWFSPDWTSENQSGFGPGDWGRSWMSANGQVTRRSAGGRCWSRRTGTTSISPARPTARGRII